MAKSMSEKVVVVTGAGRGIGEATARLFAAEGARVVIASRSAGDLERVKATIGTDRVLAVVTDVSDEAQVFRLFEETEKKMGPVDVLVNNAGILRVAEVVSMTAEDWDDVIAVNLKGSFLCAREAFRRMKSSGRGGSIVNVSSLSGIRGVEKFPGYAAYVASKHGVVGLTEVLAVEGRPLGIRVNCVAPGAVDTEMLHRAAPGLKTSTRPEDIARTVLYLADDKASPKVTGAVIEIHSNE